MIWNIMFFWALPSLLDMNLQFYIHLFFYHYMYIFIYLPSINLSHYIVFVSSYCWLYNSFCCCCLWRHVGSARCRYITPIRTSMAGSNSSSWRHLSIEPFTLAGTWTEETTEIMLASYWLAKKWCLLRIDWQKNNARVVVAGKEVRRLQK